MKTILPLLKTLLGYCPVVGFMVVLSSLIFEYSTVQQVALIFTGVTYVLDFVLNFRWRSWRWTNDKWVFVVSVVFFLLFPLWIVFGIETGPRLSSYMETYLPFAILGVVGILGLPPTAKIEWFALVALATVSAVVMYICMQVGWNHVWVDIHAVCNPFNGYRAHAITSHMHFNLYANMALVLGIAAVRQRSLHRAWKIVLLVLMTITCVAVGISEGRTGLLTMFLLIGLSILHDIWNRNKVIAFVVGVVCSFIVGGVVAHSLGSHYATIAQEPRQYVWAVALDQIMEHPVVGYGPSNGHELFVQRGMQDEDFVTYYAQGLILNNPAIGEEVVNMAHPHNMFLEIAIAYGVFGVVLLLLLLCLPVLLARPGHRFPVLLCELTFLIQGMFEKMGSDLNPLLWLIVLLLLFAPNHDETVSDNA